MGSETVKRIQQKLQDKGLDPGVGNGIWGRHTIAAGKQFQRQENLEVDGVVGPQTTAALFTGASPVPPTAASLYP